MASRKNNQETSKQSTLLRWVRPDREPWKTENRGEQAVLEETSQESDEQAAGTSNTSNSNINTTPQGPELPPTPDLLSVSKGPSLIISHTTVNDGQKCYFRDPRYKNFPEEHSPGLPKTS